MNSVTVERQRLAALRRLRVLDSVREHTFERITATLARLLEVPSACVALVDEDRVWFKSAYGFDLPELAREPGFIATTIESPAVLYLRDASTDPVASKNWLATHFGARFYAGAPLSPSDDLRIGCLCAFGPEPRELTDVERNLIVHLADLTTHELRLRREHGVIDPCSRGSVLIVDADETVLVQVRKTLLKAGFEILTAATYDAVLDALERAAGDVDVLILDAGLPEGEFAGVLAETVRRCPGVQVVYSGSRGMRAMAFGEGSADHFLEKPFGPAELTGLIERVVSQE